MLNRLKVMICGKEYMLQTEEPPSYVYGLAKMLEKRLNDMCSGTVPFHHIPPQLW